MILTDLYPVIIPFLSQDTQQLLANCIYIRLLGQRFHSHLFCFRLGFGLKRDFCDELHDNSVRFHFQITSKNKDKKMHLQQCFFLSFCFIPLFYYKVRRSICQGVRVRLFEQQSQHQMSIFSWYSSIENELKQESLKWIFLIKKCRIAAILLPK